MKLAFNIQLQELAEPFDAEGLDTIVTTAMGVAGPVLEAMGGRLVSSDRNIRQQLIFLLFELPDPVVPHAALRADPLPPTS